MDNDEAIFVLAWNNCGDAPAIHSMVYHKRNFVGAWVHDGAKCYVVPSEYAVAIRSFVRSAIWILSEKAGGGEALELCDSGDCTGCVASSKL